ncbi:hypothetical protein PG988_009819 [Apiospora saccharicola]
MDIDDILREVDPSSSGLPSSTRDLQSLTRVWVAERSTPELQSWPTDGLVERVNGRIASQIERVEALTGDMDPRSNFALIVIQTELERYKFLVRSYLRARLAKVDRHALHYLSTPELRARLSPTELAYATRHQALLHNHYLASFLGAPSSSGCYGTRVSLARGVDADGDVEGKTGDIIILRWSDAKPLVDTETAELV